MGGNLPFIRTRLNGQVAAIPAIAERKTAPPGSQDGVGLRTRNARWAIRRPLRRGLAAFAGALYSNAPDNDAVRLPSQNNLGAPPGGVSVRGIFEGLLSAVFDGLPSSASGLL
ncbi:MAG: hypothetical protein ACLPN5_09290 [Roseiarcus sp.]